MAGVDSHDAFAFSEVVARRERLGGILSHYYREAYREAASLLDRALEKDGDVCLREYRRFKSDYHALTHGIIVRL